MAVDIEASTTRTNPQKARLRQVAYDIVGTALDEAGITADHRDPFIDRGDGVLVLVHASDAVPKPLLLCPVMPLLSALLQRHGAAHPNERIRLRAVVHAGDVHYDSNGCFGEALDLAFRLLDSPAVKRCLQDTVEPLVLVISDDIHRSVVRHGYPGIDERLFDRRVTVQVGRRRHRGWIRTTDGG